MRPPSLGRTLNPARLAASAPIFAALGDETRLAIVARLSSGEAMSIARLTDGTSVTRQAVSKHLRVLEGAGLVRSARQGRESVFELDPKSVDAARRCLDRISRAWDDRLERLRALVED